MKPLKKKPNDFFRERQISGKKGKKKKKRRRKGANIKKSELIGKIGKDVLKKDQNNV